MYRLIIYDADGNTCFDRRLSEREARRQWYLLYHAKLGYAMLLLAVSHA